MILELHANASATDSAIASVVLALHITAGLVGLIAGGIALVVGKGSWLHRRSGVYFVAAMLVMSTIGGLVAPLLPQRSSIVPAALTFYLVATGWMAVRRRARTIGAFEVAAFVFAWVFVCLGVAFAVEASDDPRGQLDGAGPAVYLVFAAITGLAGTLDGFVLARGGVDGAHRIARHAWRMCVALLIAASSFFLGQQQLFPRALRGSPLLYLPELAILATMIFWLVRIYAGRVRSAR